MRIFIHATSWCTKYSTYSARSKQIHSVIPSQQIKLRSAASKCWYSQLRHMLHQPWGSSWYHDLCLGTPKGIDSKSFQVKKTEAESEEDVPYGYGFIHYVFAIRAMYFAMLFIGWNAHNTMRKWTIDVGWASTWVKIVNQWLATLVYMWMLVAPLVWKVRRGESASM